MLEIFYLASDDSTPESYEIYSRESKFISFRSKLRKSFLSTSLILTKGKTSYQF